MSRSAARRRSAASLSFRRLLIGVAIGLGGALVAFAASRLDFFTRVENASYDWRVRRTAEPVGAESPIVLVEINESTLRALEPLAGRWPWPRIVHAGAIDYLAQSGAKVIAYDVLFLEEEGRSETTINGQAVTGAQSDLALAGSIEAAGNVVLLAEATFEGLARESSASLPAPPPSIPGMTFGAGEGFYPRPLLQLPLTDFVLGARGVGHNYLARDPGSDFARRMLPFVDARGAAVPSLGMAAALAYLGVHGDSVRVTGDRLQVGSASVPLIDTPATRGDGSPAPSRQVLLNFRQPVADRDGIRSVFPAYSFFDVLLSGDQAASGAPPAIPRQAFEGKLVFVGTSAAGTFDRFATPFSSGAPGIELHATVAENILSQRFMRRAPRAADTALTLAAGLASGIAALLLPLVWAVVAVIVLVSLGLWWLTDQVGQGLWIAAVAPTMSAAIAVFGGVAWQYFVEGREKRHIRALFGRYVPRDVIDELMANPAMAALGGARRQMSVLFSDMRGFTAATERAEPEQVVAQLNEYFEEMVAVLFRHQGTLDKFVGDMVMGLFGAPLDDPRHADHAVAAAIDMTVTLEALNRRWQATGRPPVQIGIGINSGEMIAGNIGSSAIMSYTVIGDAVNLGSRLESLNKEYGTRILISEATRAHLTIPVVTRPIGEVAVKGRARTVMVYEVLGFEKDERPAPALAGPVSETE